MDERAPNQFPVTELADNRLELPGGGVLPLCLNQDWAADLSGVRGALVMLHGRLRDAPTYMRTALAAVGTRPGWLVAVPQFLAAIDLPAHGLPADTLHWELTGWMGGDAAEGPVATSSFAAIDALLDRIQAQCPRLERLVLAGHSGGGQVAQRYAVLGAKRPGLRYVIANPSSYAWLSSARPGPLCDGYDDWKYGLSALPDYAGGMDRAALAWRYAQRDVTYLLGGDDRDPAHPALDNAAAARSQGPHRLARGEAFFADLHRQFPDTPHTLHIVPGVGHDGRGIFTNGIGEAALFG